MPDATASSAQNPGEEGPEPEPEPELEPAIDGDVDGDDKADLVALNTSGTAYTYKGSDGSSKTTAFGGGMNSSLFDGVEHHVIDVADVNADGYSDLVTLSFNSGLGINNMVCVFPGQSDGSFGAGILGRGNVIPGTFGPNGHEPIGVADVNRDRRADLVTFYAPQGNFYYYPGREDGKFDEGITMGGGQVNSALFDRKGVYFVDVKDVNGDERADVVGISADGANSSYGAAITYTGSSFGINQWGTQVHPKVEPVMSDGSGHEPVGLGDVNGDGKADLVTINPSGSASVYAGMSTLDEASQTYQLLDKTAVTSLSSLNSSLMDGSGDDFVTLMDKTHDGKDDLVKVAADGTVSVAPGQANLQFGSFAQWVTGVTSNRFNPPSSNELVQEKPFLRRLGCAPVGCTGRPLPPSSDVDGDRRSDLVTLDNTGTSNTYRAVGELGHATSLVGGMDPALYDGKGHHVIDVNDVNGDWRADKVTLSNGTVYVHLGRTDGTFGAGIGSFSGSMTPGPFDEAGWQPVAVADVTGDGKGDLVAFKESDGVKVYAGSEAGTFGSPAVSLTGLKSSLFGEHGGYGVYILDVADVTGDRLADLVMTSTSLITVLEGTTSGKFVEAGSANIGWGMSSGEGREPVGLGDVDGDGFADLTTLSEGTVSVYEGSASGEFDITDAYGPSPSGTSFDGSMDSNLYDSVGDEIVGLLDENGDRKADLITVREDGTARIYLGKSDFTFTETPRVRTLDGFTPGRFYRVPGHEVATEKPFFLRAGCPGGCYWPPVTVESDVDGDRRSDVVAVHSHGGAQVFRGHEDGIYGTSTSSIADEVDPALFDGKGDYVVDVADVTGDRLSDLVTLSDAGSIQVHPGRGNRSFAAASVSQFTLPPSLRAEEGFEPIAVADVTGDQRGDLVGFRKAGAESSLATYTGLSDGTFISPEDEALYSQQGAVDSALKDRSGEYFLDAIDVTGDRLADVVSVSTTGTVRVYKGQEDGKFGSAITAATGVDPIMDNGSGQEPVGLGDVTGDGRADLLVLNGPLKLYAGKSDGTFATPTSPFAGNGTNPANIDSSLVDGEGQEFIGLLDYSHDGRADLVTAHYTAAGYTGFKTYEAQTDGTFAIPWSHPGSMPSNRFNSLPGLQFAAEKPFLLRTGCASSGCEWPPVNRTESDVDGDGRADLVTLHTNGHAYAYGGVTSGFDLDSAGSSFAGSMDSALFDDSGEYMVDVADVDGDNRADLVTQGEDGEVSVHPGKVDRTFASAVAAYTLDSGLEALEPVAAADVTGDRLADLVQFGVDGEGQVLVAPGQADGTFSEEDAEVSLQGANSALGDGSGEYFLDAIDVTGDGRADLVSISTSGTLKVYKGQADAKFAAATTAASSVSPIMDDGSGHEPVGLGDVNGDGRADLLTLDASGTPKLFAGKTDGTFATPTTAIATTIDSSLMDGTGKDLAGLFDNNRDGRTDLVMISKGGIVTVHRAESDGTFKAGALQSGSVLPNRFATVPGEELIAEKPLLRRAGCAPSGCDWPPAPAEEEGEEEAEPTAWSKQPLGEASQRMTDVWCENSWNCLAVGEAVTDSGTHRAQVSWGSGEEWSHSWPLKAESRSTALNGVGCLSSSACTAVGSYDNGSGPHALMLKWESSSWTEVSVPEPSGAKSSTLSDVSCADSSNCMAVGSYVSASGATWAMAVRWNGSSWSVTTTPTGSLAPTAYIATSSTLSDVSCATTTTCAAVGSYVEQGTGKTKGLGLRWSSSAWSAAATPGMAGANERELAGVACTSSSSCVAVGHYTAASGEIRNWTLSGDGSSWSTTASSNSSTNSALTAVDCAGSTCFASGGSTIKSKTHPTVLVSTSGADWEDHVLDPPAGAGSTELAGIACPEGECNAVGTTSYADFGERNVAYSFSGGSGSLTDSGGSAGSMRAISCVSGTQCTAVSDGAGWKLDSGEWTATGGDEVSGPALGNVSCTAAGECTAVGSERSTWPPTPLAERWNGTSWSVQTTPNPGGGGDLGLNGVSCYASNGCISVGWYWQSSRHLPLAQKWNGSSWSAMTVPTPAGTPASTMLRDVACTSSNDCFAVGSSSASSNYALIERWNGSTWSLQSVTLPGGSVGGNLKAISCTSSSACTAVGTYTTNPGSKLNPLVLRWDGSSWTVQLSSPPSGALGVNLYDVACYSASGCVTVGDYWDASGYKPLAMRWNGSTWTLESTPLLAGKPHSYLESVSCPSAESCKAVGAAQFESGRSELLVLVPEG